jgi:hypothetical protein
MVLGSRMKGGVAKVEYREVVVGKVAIEFLVELRNQK